MAQVLQPWQLFLAVLAGWINKHQQAAIDYLREENRVLKEQLGGKRLRLTDDQRRRLAAKGKAHWSVLAAADFFTIEVWAPRGLVTFYVFFVIELATRRVEIAGITPGPNEAWMMQVGRNLTDPVDGFLRHKTKLIVDRDSKYSLAFRNLLDNSGIEIVRLPPRSPNLNAYAERFVRSIKSECLGRMIFFGERSLRKAAREYAAHYHRERNHQGLDNQLIDSADDTASDAGEVSCWNRLVGMLRLYHRAAA